MDDKRPFLTTRGGKASSNHIRIQPEHHLRQNVRDVVHPVLHGWIDEFYNGDALEIDILHRASTSSGVFRLILLTAEVEITGRRNVGPGANSCDLTTEIMLLQTWRWSDLILSLTSSALSITPSPMVIVGSLT